MIKIVSIVWYKVLPALYGGQKGIAHFNQHLSLHYPLACICSESNDITAGHSYKLIPELPVTKKQFINPFVIRKIIRLIVKEGTTHIIIEHPYHGIAAYLARKRTGAKLIIHSHNIESQRFRQLGKWWWRILHYYEKWVHQKADLSLFKTEADRQWAIQNFGLVPGNCMIIPYGVNKPVRNESADLTIRQRHGIMPEEKIILFAGTLDYAPNAEAVETIYTHIAPLLAQAGCKCKIIICGRNRDRGFHYLKRLSHPVVIFAGEVGDIENYFFTADVFINPVMSGSGIQTKNIDAIAHDCTVVCFAKMATGLTKDICGPKLQLARDGDWNNFAALVTGGLKQAERTPDSFFNYFGWNNIIHPFIARIGEMTNVEPATQS